ncbi:MAG TPA: hypothetical protein PK990_07450 [Salinivirgaceae bacterium]|nr:hypothetical protein [Salinivirgaceae bacterium]
MKSPLTISLFSVILWFNVRAMAQDTEDFILCDSAFLVRVNEMIINNFESKREANKYFESFTKAWKSDFFSTEMQFDICEISQNLIIRRQVAFQSYKSYLDLLISFAQKSEQRQNYQIFNYLLKEYCNNNELSFSFISAFIQRVKSLIEGNLLFDSPQTQWKSTINNYEFTISDDGHLEINFPSCDLICYAQNDSIVIYDTEGKYSLKDLIFRGERGKVTWERAGYSPDSMYAVFAHYSMELTRSLLIVDTVEFYNYVFFEEPIFGRLRYQAEKILSPSEARFPKFESFQKQFTLSELYPKVDYIGGYVQHGSRFIGSGTKEEPAILDFWREFNDVINGDTVQTMKVALRCMSEEYTFTKDKVYSDFAIISIYLDQDSIYHPGIKMQFFVQPREVYLLQDNDLANMSRASYYDSYHMLEFRAELLTWKLDQHNVFFTRMLGTQSSKAIFESYNYFAADRFFKLQGIDHQHPLFQIRDFVQKRGNETFTATELGAFMRYSESKMRQLLLLLSFEGYVYYDRQTFTATVRPKLYESCLAATNQKDYDVIAIESEMEGRNPNAVLNLKNYDINIFGIKSFPFSKTNRIIAFPQNGTITLQRDRNILFGGILRAGLYSFFGKRFVFNYQQFKIDLEEVDKMLLDVVTGMQPNGEYIVEKVNNSISDIKGFILIDNPKNKSSRYSIPKYPILESTQNSYVFYDHLFNGEYHRDSVYFSIDPFTVDSINNPQAERVKLTGEFYSGNIFPVFRENLTIQKDLSLGFIHKLPEAGFKTYGGIGTSLGTIEVANNGIKLQGQVNYRRTSTWSDEFTFFPDSMLSQSKRFLNRSSSEPSLPLMDGKDIFVRWMPYQDRIIGKTTTAPIDMFNAQASLSGTFVVEPNVATGNGTMDIERSKLLSNEFIYTENTISSEKAEWNLKTKDGTSLAYESNDLKAFIDFTQRKGTFTSNSSDNIMRFPVNQYLAYADQVVWNMDQDNLAIATEKVHSFEDQRHAVLSTPTSLNPSGSLFISTHPRQDSLNFISPIAYIDLSQNIISAQKVGFVNIADVSIHPFDSIITINPNAQHKTLTKAVILADRQNKYHRIYDATVNISGRKIFSANGSIDYVDVDRNRQVIKLEVITVNKETNTSYGTGRIAEGADFTLSPAFRFKGDVKLFAANPNLFFQGYAKMKWLPSDYTAHWIKFS